MGTLRLSLRLVFAIASISGIGCQPPIPVSPEGACIVENKGKRIMVTGKLQFGTAYVCKPDFGKVYCAASFTGPDGQNKLYLSIAQGSGPNQIDFPDKRPETATVRDRDGTQIGLDAAVTIIGMVQSVGEHQGIPVCTVRVSEIEKR